MNTLGHILLVEDDPALRIILSSLLKQNAYRVSEANSRISALELLKLEQSIEVLILDLGLPPHPHSTDEGIFLLKTLQISFNSVKVIVLTGQDQEAAALEAVRDGAFDFLAKPARTEDILGAIRRALLFVHKEQELHLQGITKIAINAQISDGLKAVRVDAEEKLVRQILKETGFNINQCAKRLGVKRENIYYFLKKFGIERDA